MSHSRFVAVRYLERHDKALPSGTRIELLDSARPAVPANLTVKVRGRQGRIRLYDYMAAAPAL